MPTLGSFVRRRREELGLTQEQLADRIGEGVRQAEISRLENDRVTLPRRQRLERIARALDVPIGALLARSGWTGADEIGKQELKLSAAVGSIDPADPADRARATAAFLKSILDGIDDGVAVIDAAGAIMVNNATYASYATGDDPNAVFFDEHGRVVACSDRWFGPIVTGRDEGMGTVSTVRENERITYEARAKSISMDAGEAFRIVTLKFCENGSH